jgi:hypothetical protein
MKPPPLFLKSLLLVLFFGMTYALVAAQGVRSTFFSVRAGKALFLGEHLLAKKPILVKRGVDLEFVYQEAEIINIARVLSATGELLLETRSLDAVVFLTTVNLRPGKYTFEVQSGELKADGVLLVK